ncbi:hypothetical protein [Romboutsia sp.]|uniref:hypothetical protein n=1 Tax=Romboutsia sp. TaxID=1965302 RepID=UPI003F332BC9
MHKFQSFIGKWEMIPRQNNYQIGAPPKEGTYIISLVEENTLRFDIDWTDENDQKHTMVYLSQVDGKIHEYENTDIIESVKTTLIANNKLESCTYKGSAKICYSMQESIENGEKLLVNQTGLLSDGGKFVNKSIYKKVSIEAF